MINPKTNLSIDAKDISVVELPKAKTVGIKSFSWAKFPDDCILEVISYFESPKELVFLRTASHRFKLLSSAPRVMKRLMLNKNNVMLCLFQQRVDYRKIVMNELSRIKPEICNWCSFKSLEAPSVAKMRMIYGEIFRADEIRALISEQSQFHVRQFSSEENFYFFERCGGNVHNTTYEIDACSAKIVSDLLKRHKETRKAILDDDILKSEMLTYAGCTVKETARTKVFGKVLEVEIPEGGEPKRVRVLSSDKIFPFLQPRERAALALTCGYVAKIRLMAMFCDKSQYAYSRAEKLAVTFIFFRDNMSLGKLLKLRDLFLDGAERLCQPYIEGCAKFFSVHEICQMVRSTRSPVWQSLNEKQFLREIAYTVLYNRHLKKHLKAVKDIVREREG